MNIFEDSLYMPKYIQIQNYILMKIANHEFMVGEKIPSEYELAKMFDVSRVTANMAIKELATRGVVERIRGKGTFVAQNKNNGADTQPMVFSSGIKLNPISSGQHKEHILISHETIEADIHLCSKLKISYGEKVYRIIRQVNINARPEELDYSYIPMSILGTHILNLDKIEESCLHDYIGGNLARKPKYVKIFINSQPQWHMDFSALEKNAEGALFIWDTYVYDDAGIIALTVTASIPKHNKPFMLLEL